MGSKQGTASAGKAAADSNSTTPSPSGLRAPSNGSAAIDITGGATTASGSSSDHSSTGPSPSNIREPAANASKGQARKPSFDSESGDSSAPVVVATPAKKKGGGSSSTPVVLATPATVLSKDAASFRRRPTGVQVASEAQRRVGSGGVGSSSQRQPPPKTKQSSAAEKSWELCAEWPDASDVQVRVRFHVELPSRSSGVFPFGQRAVATCYAVPDEHFDDFSHGIWPPVAEPVLEVDTRALVEHVRIAEKPLSKLLSDKELDRLITVLEERTFEVGQPIIKEGDPGEAFYIIKSGEVSVSTQRAGVVATLNAGDFFGEAALLNDEPRMATVTAASTVVSLALQRRTFTGLFGTLTHLMNLQLVRSVSIAGRPLVSLLTRANLDALISALEDVSFARGENVITQGTIGEHFYIIKSGKAVVSTTQQGQVAVLSDGDFFGEMALMNNDPRAATVSAASSTLKCLMLQRKTFAALTTGEAVDSIQAVARERQIQNESKMMDNLRLLQQVKFAGTSLISLLTKPLPMLINALSEVIFLENAVIVEQGEATSQFDTTCLYIIKSGKAAVLRDGEELAILRDGDFFGEMALVNDEPRAATVVAASPSLTCLSLSKGAFNALTSRQALDGLRQIADKRRKANQRDSDSEGGSRSGSPECSRGPSPVPLRAGDGDPAEGVSLQGAAQAAKEAAEVARVQEQLLQATHAAPTPEPSFNASRRSSLRRNSDFGGAPSAAPPAIGMRQLDRYRLRSANRATSFSHRPAALPPTRIDAARFKLGNLGFRGLAQLLLDHGVASVDLWAASSKHELFEVARRHHIDLSQLCRQEAEQLEADFWAWREEQALRSSSPLSRRARTPSPLRTRPPHSRSSPGSADTESRSDGDKVDLW